MGFNLLIALPFPPDFCLAIKQREKEERKQKREKERGKKKKRTETDMWRPYFYSVFDKVLKKRLWSLYVSIRSNVEIGN